MKDLNEFLKEFYPEVLRAFDRYEKNDQILPIGTVVRTLRAGFGGSGDDTRIIENYYTKEYNLTKDPKKGIAYALQYPKETSYYSSSARTTGFISLFKNAWRDFEVIKIEPEIKVWNEMKLVRISSVGEEFRKWLYGQTLPLVEDDEKPTDWAYYWDYERFVSHKPIID